MLPKLTAQDSRENQSAALKGIFSGGVLSVVEITAGLISGSLGLVSSALNSMTDTIAAVITFFAVKASSKPPDEVHMYGHQKIESAAAIGEVVLLFIICVWIVYSAVIRLITAEARVEQFWIALSTNFLSVALDSFAYFSLRRAIRKRASEASEAGSLHFLNDLLIAIVVIVGLAFYRFGAWYADSIAALGIVSFIVYSSIDLVRNSFSVLLDAAPPGSVEQLRSQILKVPGVKGTRHIRIRKAGSQFFVDAQVNIDGYLPISQAHMIVSQIEEQITHLFPDSDIMIHTEPHIGEDPLSVIRLVASRTPEIKGIHGIVIKTIKQRLYVAYHLELDQEISVKTAHQVASQMERQLNTSLKNVASIISHLEPGAGIMQRSEEKSKETKLQEQIIRVSESFPSISSTHEIQILAHDDRYSVTLHCAIDGSIPLIEAHDISTKMEEEIKRIDERIDDVVIHCEPVEEAFSDDS